MRLMPNALQRPAGVSRLQSLRLMRRVAGSLDGFPRREDSHTV